MHYKLLKAGSRGSCSTHKNNPFIFLALHTTKKLYSTVNKRLILLKLFNINRNGVSIVINHCCTDERKNKKDIEIKVICAVLSEIHSCHDLSAFFC